MYPYSFQLHAQVALPAIKKGAISWLHTTIVISFYGHRGHIPLRYLREGGEGEGERGGGGREGRGREGGRGGGGREVGEGEGGR